MINTIMICLILLLSFISFTGVCYIAGILDKQYKELVDLTKDVLHDNKIASNDMKTLLGFYQQVCDECKEKTGRVSAKRRMVDIDISKKGDTK